MNDLHILFHKLINNPPHPEGGTPLTPPPLTLINNEGEELIRKGKGNFSN